MKVGKWEVGLQVGLQTGVTFLGNWGYKTLARAYRIEGGERAKKRGVSIGNIHFSCKFQGGVIWLEVPVCGGFLGVCGCEKGGGGTLRGTCRGYVSMGRDGLATYLTMRKRECAYSPLPWQFLNFFPDPQGHGSFRPGVF